MNPHTFGATAYAAIAGILAAAVFYAQTVTFNAGCWSEIKWCIGTIASGIVLGYFIDPFLLHTCGVALLVYCCLVWAAPPDLPPAK